MYDIKAHKEEKMNEKQIEIFNNLKQENNYYELLKQIYKFNYEKLDKEFSYKEFFEDIETNSKFTLNDIELFKSNGDYLECYDKFETKLRDWLKEESYQLGCNNELDYLSTHLKIELDDFLKNNGLDFKVKLIDTFVYSTSTSLYDYMQEELNKEDKDNHKNIRKM